MISMNRARVKAVVTETGGRTSHVAILARAFEIPAVLGVAGALSRLRGARLVAVDGDRGLVVADPDKATLARNAAASSAAAQRLHELGALRDLPAATYETIRRKLETLPHADRLLAILESDEEDDRALGRIFGEELPSGLVLAEA